MLFFQFQPIRIQCNARMKIIEFLKNHETKNGDLRNFWWIFFGTCDFGGGLLKCRQFKKWLRKILDNYQNVDISEICLDSHKLSQL